MLLSQRNQSSGFTLAELLISLAILGVITTFTIPKILGSSQNQQYSAAAREAIATISGAYQQHQLNGLLTTSTKPSDLTQYMNFVAVDTASQLDSHSGGTKTCDNTTSTCIKLQNGGTLLFADWATFSGSSNLSAAWFLFDPNGRVDVSGPQKGAYGLRFITMAEFQLMIP